MEKGITQEQLAWDCDVEKSHLSMVESGKRMPSLPMLLVLAKQLDVQVADVVAYDLDEPRLGLLNAVRRKDIGAALKLLKRLGIS
jgi:transcriptional regulator with XRE-family HTH domain